MLIKYMMRIHFHTSTLTGRQYWTSEELLCQLYSLLPSPIISAMQHLFCFIFNKLYLHTWYLLIPALGLLRRHGIGRQLGTCRNCLILMNVPLENVC